MEGWMNMVFLGPRNRKNFPGCNDSKGNPPNAGLIEAYYQGILAKFALRGS